MKRRRRKPKPKPSGPPKRRSRQAKINITKEANYIIQCAQNGDGRVVAIGQFVFFSTATGDAWILEPGEQLALELARHGEEQANNALRERFGKPPRIRWWQPPAKFAECIATIVGRY